MSKYPSPDFKARHTRTSLSLRKGEINSQKPQKYLLLAQGTEQSLKLLAPHMKADEPEVIDLFARLNFYQEQHRNAECEYGTLSCNTPDLHCARNSPPHTHNFASRFSGSSSH
ncbi:hypothetical protein TNCV_4517851 [Trichonephila clavipes]|nr:hypothetical protein TNCV_4517851 [Trichonephila clavipes]